jgi:hypothetical protein
VTAKSSVAYADRCDAHNYIKLVFYSITHAAIEVTQRFTFETILPTLAAAYFALVVFAKEKPDTAGERTYHGRVNGQSSRH